MAYKSKSDHELRQHFEMLQGVEHHKNELILVNTSPIFLDFTQIAALTFLIRNFFQGSTG